MFRIISHHTAHCRRTSGSVYGCPLSRRQSKSSRTFRIFASPPSAWSRRWCYHIFVRHKYRRLIFRHTYRTYLVTVCIIEMLSRAFDIVHIILLCSYGLSVLPSSSILFTQTRGSFLSKSQVFMESLKQKALSPHSAQVWHMPATKMAAPHMK